MKQKFDLTRRDFIKIGSAATLAGVAHNLSAAETPLDSKLESHNHASEGTDLSEWTEYVGDGGTGDTTKNDILTEHFGTYSELQANINQRDISAHNFNEYKIFDDATLLLQTHSIQYQFRIPYTPNVQNEVRNPQTIEGGFYIYDGQTTRQTYSVLFQWMLTPFVNDCSTWEMSDVRVWNPNLLSNEKWNKVGQLPINTNWHTLNIVCDFPRQLVKVTIDNIVFPACIGINDAPSFFWSDISAGITAEIISVDPIAAEKGMLHVAEFRDWSWHRETTAIPTGSSPLVEDSSGSSVN